MLETGSASVTGNSSLCQINLRSCLSTSHLRRGTDPIFAACSFFDTRSWT